MAARLSKSRFISGCQCPLKLWFDVSRPGLAAPPDERRQAMFATGREVGALARARWPGGVLVSGDPRRVEGAVEQTTALLDDPSVPAIFEAVFSWNDVLVRVDVLARTPNGAWDLVEVKSSTRLKASFYTDVAVQYWVLRGVGVPVGRAGLLLLNRDYVYPGGELDLQALFRFEDLTQYCMDCINDIGTRVEDFHAVVRRADPPEVSIGEHCHKPYPCDYWHHCTRDLIAPDYPLDGLPGLPPRRRWEWFDQGIESVDRIPDEYPLTARQALVRDCVVNGRPWVSPGLDKVLSDVAWPLHFLDFEAVQFAIPRYTDTRPYDQIPFQFSCHHQSNADGELTHDEFLAVDSGDPRTPFGRALLHAVGTHGSIVVYSGYERRMIEQLAAWQPELAEPLMALRERLIDLLAILQQYYYHPEFNGSYSIKYVLPVLVPELSYTGMEVADGEAAGRAWLDLISTQDLFERRRLEDALRAYCRQDSLAMARLRQALLVEAGAVM